MFHKHTLIFSLLQDLSVCTKIFDPVTLASNFDLILINFTLAFSFELEEILFEITKVGAGMLVPFAQPRSSLC